MSWDTDLLQDFIRDAFDVPLTDEEIAIHSVQGMAETDENMPDDDDDSSRGAAGLGLLEPD